MSGDVGCFVYRVVDSIGIEVRRAPSVEPEYKTNRFVGKGDLVSVDLIVRGGSHQDQDGPFLRLSDGSGWLFEKKHGNVCMEPVEVQTGLWCFYLGNFPVGLALRNHPIDQLQGNGHCLSLYQVPETTLPPETVCLAYH